MRGAYFGAKERVMPSDFVAMETMELVRDLVYLRVTGRSGLIARVVAIEGDRLVLTQPVDEEGRPIAASEGTPLEVGWMTKIGIKWHDALVTAKPVGDPRAFVVKLTEERTVRSERRSHPRARVELDCEVSPIGGEPVHGRIVDIGGGGIAAIVPLELQPGDAVQMTVVVPHDEPIRLTATCVRTTGEGPAGFAYGLFAAGTRDRLVELAFRRAAEAA